MGTDIEGRDIEGTSHRAWHLAPALLSHLHSEHIRGQAWKAQVEMLVHLKHLLEVGGDGLLLYAESPVRADGKALLTYHSHHGCSIIIHDRLQERGQREHEMNKGRKVGWVNGEARINYKNWEGMKNRDCEGGGRGMRKKE